tara:strand:- start:497 stop:1582 length:1086 start_codon:yes stop_codon:yes gene_type:complete
MITIKEIAKKANVSTGTVDRVLHNRAGVSLKTKEKILILLKENNFKKNVIASTLAMRKKYTVAVLIPEYDSKNLFWKSPYLGIQKAAEEVNDYGIQISYYLYNQFESSSFSEQFEKLISKQTDAVLLVPTFAKQTTVFVKELEYKNIPYLFLNVDLNGFNNLSYIGSDSFKSGVLAGKLMHLCISNPQVILTIQTSLRDHNYHVTTKRIEGFTAYFNESKIAHTHLSISFNNLDHPLEIRKKLNSFLNKNNSVNGIFVPSSRIGIIAKEIDKEKIARLKLVGFDTTEHNVECLKDNEVTFLISQKSYNQGYDAIHILTKFFTQKIIPKQKNYSPLEILTKENLEFSDKTGLLAKTKKEDLL